MGERGRFIGVRVISGDWVVINVDQISLIRFKKGVNCFEISFAGATTPQIQLFQEEASKIFGLIGIQWN